MAPPNITTARTPIRSASQPMAMPPQPAPMNVRPTASAGADRVAPNSAAIGFRATTVASGAPYDTLSTVRATMATTQDVRVSTLPTYALLPSIGPGFLAVRTASFTDHGGDAPQGSSRAALFKYRRNHRRI